MRKFTRLPNGLPSKTTVINHELYKTTRDEIRQATGMTYQEIAKQLVPRVQLTLQKLNKSKVAVKIIDRRMAEYEAAQNKDEESSRTKVINGYSFPTLPSLTTKKAKTLNGPELVGALREHKERNGLSQAVLARALKVSAQTVSQWMADVNVPQSSNLSKIATYLERAGA
jgi:DNA-binding transcriptional regulator YiaG